MSESSWNISRCAWTARPAPPPVPAASMPGNWWRSSGAKGKRGRGFPSWKSWSCAGCCPTRTAWKPPLKPMRLYQRSGLQKVVRKLGLLKMFPAALERMEGLLPELPARPLRQTIEHETPATGEQRGTVGFFLGCVMSLIFSEASLPRSSCSLPSATR